MNETKKSAVLAQIDELEERLNDLKKRYMRQDEENLCRLDSLPLDFISGMNSSARILAAMMP